MPERIPGLERTPGAREQKIERAEEKAASPSEQACDKVVKPLLSVEQQIAHMKSKGIAFELCPEEEATAHLRDKCQFFRIYAYRRMFDKYVGGDRDGQYIGLDFEHLRVLSNIDGRFRDVLLPMTLDVEHFAKVRLIAAAESAGDDGHAIMRDYLDSRGDGSRKSIQRELEKRANDAYAGAVVRKYRNDMTIWAFSEVVPFGTFLDLLKFCADKWEDHELRGLHYLLKYVRFLRNCCAHGACILNDFFEPAEPFRAPVQVVKALASCGIAKHARSKWMKSVRMVQVCSLIYLYGCAVPEGLARSDRQRSLGEFFAYGDRKASLFADENPAVAVLSFTRKLTVGLGLLK